MAETSGGSNFVELSNSLKNSSSGQVNDEPTATAPTHFPDDKARYDLVVEMLSGGYSMKDTAKAVGFKRPRMLNVCRTLIEIGKSSGIPRGAMENILYPRRFGTEGERGDSRKYSAPAVSLRSAARLARWHLQAEAVIQTQDEMELMGLKDLEAIMRLGHPPRPLYEPCYKDISADDYIFVYECGFRVGNAWSSWDGTHGFLTEIRGLVDVDETCWRLDSHNMDSLAEGKPPRGICFLLTLSRDLQDPKSAFTIHRGADLGFAVPPGGEDEAMEFFEGIRTKFGGRKSIAQISLKVSRSSENDCRPPGSVCYDLIR